jgi:hypothetical protein
MEKGQLTLPQIWYSHHDLFRGIFGQPFLKHIFRARGISGKGQPTLPPTKKSHGGGAWRRFNRPFFNDGILIMGYLVEGPTYPCSSIIFSWSGRTKKGWLTLPKGWISC